MDEAVALWAPDAVAPVADFQPGNLSTRFVEPPFSVLDTRSGRWQDRRRSWLSLGIKSELGRGADLLALAPAEGARERWATGAVPQQGGQGKDLAAGMRSSIATRAAMERQREPGYRYDEREGAMRSGEGRDLVPGKGNARSDYGAYTTDEEQGASGGTSIFDPVLCELAYRWWAPEGGLILDPFAGGSVRGIVAAKLGHPYTGIDLSQAQLAANRAQAAAILDPAEPMPTWLHGDSAQMDTLLPAGQMYDMVWSCPPYFDLEVYSDDPADLSAMEWPAFMLAYEAVIEAACSRLLPERFAAFVVSEVRDPTGAYRGLVPYTIHAFQRAGMRFYNEAVLVNSAGSLPLRVTKYMEASRKLGRAHQNVLVFLKGQAPRGWSYERAAPPSPQLGLGLAEEAATSEAPTSPEPLGRPEPEPEPPVRVGATEEPAAPGALQREKDDDEPTITYRPPLTTCEDHEPGHHPNQIEADRCSAEAYGEPPLEHLFDRQPDGRWADPSTGELFEAGADGGVGAPAPELHPEPEFSIEAAAEEERRAEAAEVAAEEDLLADAAGEPNALQVAPADWLAYREQVWDPSDPDRGCWTCGAKPVGTFRDGSPAYDHAH